MKLMWGSGWKRKPRSYFVSLWCYPVIGTRDECTLRRWMETYLATLELCSSNPAQCCSAFHGKQDHIWEAGLPGMTEIGTTWYFAFYFGFPLNLVHFNALVFSEALGFDDAKAFLCCHIFSKEKHVFQMLGTKLSACVLASLLLSHCYCFLFLRTWPSAPQWIRKNLSSPPSSLVVQFAPPSLFPRQQLFSTKAQEPASHKWQLKSEALPKAVWGSVKENLYI